MRGALFLVCGAACAQVYFDDSAPDRMRLGDAAYEVVLSKNHGGILALIDKRANASLTRGSRNGCLWGSNYSDAEYVGGCNFSATGANRFAYTWDSSALTFTYTRDPAAARRVTATVAITPVSEDSFDLRLAIENQWGAVLTQALFPSDLSFRDEAVQAAYLPFQLPGVRLRPSFFQNNRSSLSTYPGLYAFADYLALDVAEGRLAFYTINPSGPLQPVVLGFNDDERANPGTFYAVHTFQTHVPRGGTYTGPAVRVVVGRTPRESILGYRIDNGLADYPSIEEKLGDRFESLARAPLVKTGWLSFVRKPFRDAIADLDRLSSPALLHPVEFQPDGFDHNVPDFLPPAAQWGSTADLRAWTEAAQARGFFIMPYLNPTWWNPGSPTLQNLPPPLTLEDLAVLNAAGEPRHESYGPNGGYAVCPFVPFVQERLRQLMFQWRDEVPVDFVFLDQIGARSWLRDYNPAAPDPVSYSDGWLGFWQTYAAQALMTEDGWDRLAATGIGFCGSPLTATTSFDLRVQRYGIGGNAHRVLGPGNWDPYPLATWLMHDKVFFYHHDLETRLTTDSNEVVSWNLAFGNMMYYSWPASRTIIPGRTDLANLLQRAIAPRYAGRILDEFSWIDEEVTRSEWGDLAVVANWRPEVYLVNGSGVLPGGYLAATADGSLLAGAFQDQFNGAPLSGGEHHLLIESAAQRVAVWHPVGADTPLVAPLPRDWDLTAGVQVRALDAAGRVLQTIPSALQERGVSFRWMRTLEGRAVERYEILASSPR